MHMSLAVMEQSQRPVTITHTFGTIEAPRESVMRFVTPMWGFEDQLEFALLPAAREGLWWFISTGETPTTFVLADPFVAVEGYGIDLADAERDELSLHEESDALALLLLSMPSAPGEPVTGNFRAPLVFNVAERVVKQVVNRDEQYPLTQVVDLARYPAQSDGLQLN
jgi:flagellar assembly factor FliW